MSQINLFTGEIEAPVTFIAPEEPQPLSDTIPVLKRHKKRKDFEIGKCRACGQLLLDDPENTKIKLDEELCEGCDEKLRTKYDKFKNLALVKALRIHKYL